MTSRDTAAIRARTKPTALIHFPSVRQNKATTEMTLLTAACCILAALLGHVSADENFDYLMFTQEWPPTFCSYEHCSDFPQSKVTGWNIHGLWPSSYSGENPQYCRDGDRFDYDALGPIKGMLQTKWADLKNYDSPKQFWYYEWHKHGRCAESGDDLLNSELKYFNASINLQESFAVSKVLRSRGIVPSDDTTYQTDDIVSALRKAYGVNAGIRCYINGDDAKWIETRLCVDKKLKPIDCPQQVTDSTLRFRKSNRLGTTSCPDKITYPTFSSIVTRERYPRTRQLKDGSPVNL